MKIISYSLNKYSILAEILIFTYLVLLIKFNEKNKFINLKTSIDNVFSLYFCAS